MTYAEIARALSLDEPDPREGMASRLGDALAELKEDPRWGAIEERVLARLTDLVRSLVYEAGDPMQVQFHEMRGEARALLYLLQVPAQAHRAAKERRNEQEQSQEAQHGL